MIQPQVDSGNYFAQQNRDARRYAWSSSFAFQQWNHWGSHRFMAGTYVARGTDHGQMIEHPIEIRDVNEHLLEQIAFTGGAPYRNGDRNSLLSDRIVGVLHPRLSIDLGLRLEHQAISESLRMAPRAGVTWNPFPHSGTVIRAGVGVFDDRVPLGVYSFSQYPQRVVTLYDANGAVTAEPITYVNGLGEVISDAGASFSTVTCRVTFLPEVPRAVSMSNSRSPESCLYVRVICTVSRTAWLFSIRPRPIPPRTWPRRFFPATALAVIGN